MDYNFQFSIFNCQFSTVNCQLSIVNCQLSIVEYSEGRQPNSFWKHLLK